MNVHYGFAYSWILLECKQPLNVEKLNKSDQLELENFNVGVLVRMKLVPCNIF